MIETPPQSWKASRSGSGSPALSGMPNRSASRSRAIAAAIAVSARYGSACANSSSMGTTRPRPASTSVTCVSPSAPPTVVPATSGSDVTWERMVRVATTSKVRVTVSVNSGVRPMVVAVNRSRCVPAGIDGSATSTDWNAVPSRVRAVSGTVPDETVNRTGSLSRSAAPYARTRITGRSAARYSGATTTSAKNGSDTGTLASPTPARRSAVTADPTILHEVRSSDRSNASVARPSLPVWTSSATSQSRKSSRPSPPPPVVSPLPSPPSSMGLACDQPVASWPFPVDW